MGEGMVTTRWPDTEASDNMPALRRGDVVREARGGLVASCCKLRRRPIRVGTAFEDEDASDPSAVDEEVHDARIERGPL